ncbi:MAG: hypothetical protein V1859_05545 [archaeon]
MTYKLYIVTTASDMTVGELLGNLSRYFNPDAIAADADSGNDNSVVTELLNHPEHFNLGKATMLGAFISANDPSYVLCDPKIGDAIGADTKIDIFMLPEIPDDSLAESVAPAAAAGLRGDAQLIKTAKNLLDILSTFRFLINTNKASGGDEGLVSAWVKLPFLSAISITDLAALAQGQSVEAFKDIQLTAMSEYINKELVPKAREEYAYYLKLDQEIYQQFQTTIKPPNDASIQDKTYVMTGIMDAEVGELKTIIEHLKEYKDKAYCEQKREKIITSLIELLKQVKTSYELAKEMARKFDLKMGGTIQQIYFLIASQAILEPADDTPEPQYDAIQNSLLDGSYKKGMLPDCAIARAEEHLLAAYPKPPEPHGLFAFMEQNKEGQPIVEGAAEAEDKTMALIKIENVPVQEKYKQFYKSYTDFFTSVNGRVNNIFQFTTELEKFAVGLGNLIQHMDYLKNYSQKQLGPGEPK